MFCSKCGKEINDNAAFCDKCGSPTGNCSLDNNSEKSVYVSPKRSDLAEKEKNKKIIAICAAVVCNIVAVLFALTAFNNTGAFFTGPRVEGLEEIFSEEFQGAQIWMILPVIADIGVYVYAYFNRCFEKTFKGTVFTAVLYGLVPIWLVFSMLYICNDGLEENEYTLTFTFWLIYAVFLSIDIYRVIAYKKASDVEEYAKYDENKDTLRGLRCLSDESKNESDWKCKQCGSMNKSAQDYCKDCGKYK